MHICRTQKNSTDESICRAGKEMQIQRMDWWTQRGKVGGKNWEIRIDIDTLLCVKQIASWNLLSSTENPARCSVTIQRGEIGVGGRRKVQERGDICIHVADSLHCTAEINTTLQSNYTPIFKNREKVAFDRNLQTDFPVYLVSQNSDT